MTAEVAMVDRIHVLEIGEMCEVRMRAIDAGIEDRPEDTSPRRRVRDVRGIVLSRSQSIP